MNEVYLYTQESDFLDGRRVNCAYRYVAVTYIGLVVLTEQLKQNPPFYLHCGSDGLNKPIKYTSKCQEFCTFARDFAHHVTFFFYRCTMHMHACEGRVPFVQHCNSTNNQAAAWLLHYVHALSTCTTTACFTALVRNWNQLNYNYYCVKVERLKCFSTIIVK